jgi:hypothetical protein
VADALRQETGVEVELVDGNPGEFTVLVDGRVVAEKGLISMPSGETVLNAVREATAALTRP